MNTRRGKERYPTITEKFHIAKLPPLLCQSLSANHGGYFSTSPLKLKWTNETQFGDTEAKANPVVLWKSSTRMSPCLEINSLDAYHLQSSFPTQINTFPSANANSAARLYFRFMIRIVSKFYL